MSEPLIMDGVRIYGVLDRGNLWCMIRAMDKATFDAQALDVGLKVYTNPAVPAVTDPETGDIITPAVEASGPVVPARGVTITEMGPHVLTPGTYDENGNELTPPVLDNRYHVNFWLGSRLVEIGAWKQWALAWTLNGQSGTPNNAEESVVHEGIELIDPMTVSHAANRML